MSRSIFIFSCFINIIKKCHDGEGQTMKNKIITLYCKICLTNITYRCNMLYCIIMEWYVPFHVSIIIIAVFDMKIKPFLRGHV
jgi:hypothetical protein